jgi:hypothetical protein
VLAASAQWQWTDKDGRKVYSDRAPTSDVPEKNILKRPGGKATPSAAAPAASVDAARPANDNVTDANKTPAEAAAIAAADGAANAAAAAKDATNSPKISGVDKELEQKKKQAADAELARKKAETEKFTKAKIENCARAKQAKANLDSGVRIARANDKGEREIMDDTARAAEAKRIQAIMDADCKG